MYLAFNLETNKDYSNWYEKGKQIYQEEVEGINKNLENYLYQGTSTINGNSLESDWFPEVNADVFLSHSHVDEENAIAFAGWLKEVFGLTVFIDSCVWGHSNELLKSIDDKYCLNPSGNMYDYNKRNYSTSHVHMMLSMALSKMMDRAELVIFMATDNSIQPVSKTISHTTKSPWIYNELVMTNLIRKINPNRPIEEAFEKRAFNEAKRLDVAYDVGSYMNKLIPLRDGNLHIWEEQYQQNHPLHTHPLDFLYAQFKRPQ
ncbi:hypothetical protein NCCP2716_30990 [Sporosarcina sp. NCCP-2716]|uniref:hypothetical protein n=1 Tax=Sporosarcina sp. NCCP-2716 TaxID=2943679 RepID=UPI00203AEA15|nr:hypothetical protein [Sporosarcina sp. NCCP-2716]GKV70601.1 hypothetical protein NCCP2716_30990 [Sporosarcina sp. NCCP-2716]